MDLDGDNMTTTLEMAAYLVRNQYLVCRPVRNKVMRWDHYVFYMVYPKKSKTNIDKSMKQFDRNKDGIVGVTEFNKIIGAKFMKMCSPY